MLDSHRVILQVVFLLLCKKNLKENCLRKLEQELKTSFACKNRDAIAEKEFMLKFLSNFVVNSQIISYICIPIGEPLKGFQLAGSHNSIM
jgi:hypothetical protein